MIAIENRLLGAHEGRRGHKPIIIVNHVTVGGKGSVINTFSNLSNKVSSTFMNCRDGSIVQFCAFEQRPKTNGRIRSPRSPIVKQMGNINPNLYSVTIENEDAFNDDTPGVDGQLTEKQFYSLCWLHKYIQTEVKRIYNHTIPLNSSHVIGHRDIDSVGKALCPGNSFPFPRLYAELAIADGLSLEAYEERLDYLLNPSVRTVRAFAFADRMNSWWTRRDDPKWGGQCRVKMLMFADLLGLETEKEIYERVCKDLYEKAVSGKFVNEATSKLIVYADFAEEKGIL